MSLKKTVAIAVAAGALAAITVPAMAFENEFHGSYKLKYFLSNYENGGGGNPLLPAAGIVGVPAANGTGATENLKMNNYFEQRARMFYTAKASDDLKLVTAFEIDTIWGDYSQGGFARSANSNLGTVNMGTAFRNSGGAMESDAVNLETKWMYLNFKIPSTPVVTNVGIMPVKDSIKGIFLDADLAGILTSTKLGAATVNVGYFRAYDQSFFATNRTRGMDNLNIGAVEGKFALSKDMNLGAVYYMYGDTRGLGSNPTAATALPLNVAYSSAMLHVFGLTADAKVGPLELSGFAAYQGGIFRDVTVLSRNVGTAYHNALAYNLAAKVAAGPGKLRTALLFTSGQGDLDRQHTTGWIGVQYSPNVTNMGYNNTAANTYNESNMMLLNRAANMGGTTTDNSLVYQSGNGTNPLNSQGLYLYSLGYDANITPKFYTNANMGMAWTAKDNYLKPVDRKTGLRNSTNFMGTEINVETGYKMYDNLTASLQAAYVILGGYYEGSSSAGTTAAAKTPENPYTVRTVLTYAF